MFLVMAFCPVVDIINEAAALLLYTILGDTLDVFSLGAWLDLLCTFWDWRAKWAKLVVSSLYRTSAK
jgi:hypothetical protein